jgi:hypothetical protein
LKDESEPVAPEPTPAPKPAPRPKPDLFPKPAPKPVPAPGGWRRSFGLAALAAVAIAAACMLAHTLDTRASSNLLAIVMPVAVVLSIAATIGWRPMLGAIAAASIVTLIYYGNLFAHFRDSTMLLFWLGLTLGQLAVLLILHPTIGGKSSPSLAQIAIAMVVAALAYEFFESAGLFFGLWVGAPGTGFSEAWNDVADHITKDPQRWISALLGAAIAIVVVVIGQRLKLRRTP